MNIYENTFLFICRHKRLFNIFEHFSFSQGGGGCFGQSQLGVVSGNRLAPRTKMCVKCVVLIFFNLESLANNKTKRLLSYNYSGNGGTDGVSRQTSDMRQTTMKLDLFTGLICRTLTSPQSLYKCDGWFPTNNIPGSN